MGADVLKTFFPKTRFWGWLDMRKFAKDGEKYLRKVWSLEWYTSQKIHASSNFALEQQASKNFLKNNSFQKHPVVTKEQITKLLKKNLLIALTNPYKLNGGTGTAAHYMVLYDSDANHFYLHDPGLPGKAAWKITKDAFIQGFGNDLLIIPKE